MANVTTEVDPPERPRVPTAADRYHTGAFVEMLLSSLLGLVASLVLSIDAVALAEDPLADLSCNISETISCATVARMKYSPWPVAETAQQSLAA